MLMWGARLSISIAGPAALLESVSASLPVSVAPIVVSVVSELGLLAHALRSSPAMMRGQDLLGKGREQCIGDRPLSKKG